MTNTIAEDLIQKTFQELNTPEKPQSRSRVWNSTNGYIYLVAWSNASLFRVLGVKWMRWVKELKADMNKGFYRNLEDFKGQQPIGRPSSKILQPPLSSYTAAIAAAGWKYIDRLEGQFLDCLRSGVANMEEGYARPTTSEYLQFLGYSQGSLKEAKGDCQRSKQDGLLKSIPGTSLATIGIDLKDWHEALKQSVISKPLAAQSPNILQTPLNSFNYPPVDQLNPADLTYEIFIEIANKTDWHQRRLVESLETKLNTNRKYYQVEQARIKDAIKKR